MKNTYILLKNEIRMLLSSPAMYVVSAAFIILVLVVYSYLLFEFAQNEQTMSFAVAFFKCSWLPIIFFVPLITMRVFSEDYRTGILQNTLTTKANVGNIVVAKLLSVFLFFEIILTSIFLIFQITQLTLTEFVNNVSFVGQFEVIGGIFFLSILGLFYLSIGMFCSSLTENQVVAGMLTFGSLFGFLIFSQYISTNSINVNFKTELSLVDLISPFIYIENFCAGLIDSRPIVFYISSAIGLLFITKYIVRNKVRQ